MKCSVFIAASLDGYIAREEGEIDWLSSVEDAEGEDYGFYQFLSSVDALVMGRNTFLKVLSFDQWIYGEKRVIVLSSSPLEVPDELSKLVEIRSGSPDELVKVLSGEGAGHLYIDGGKTIQGFLESGLIDEVTISWIPVLIGSGIPLFGPLDADVRLRLVESRTYDNGIVHSKYEIVK